MCGRVRESERGCGSVWELAGACWSDGVWGDLRSMPECVGVRGCVWECVGVCGSVREFAVVCGSVESL